MEMPHIQSLDEEEETRDEETKEEETKEEETKEEDGAPMSLDDEEEEKDEAKEAKPYTVPVLDEVTANKVVTIKAKGTDTFVSLSVRQASLSDMILQTVYAKLADDPDKLQIELDIEPLQLQQFAQYAIFNNGIFPPRPERPCRFGCIIKHFNLSNRDMAADVQHRALQNANWASYITADREEWARLCLASNYLMCEPLFELLTCKMGCITKLRWEEYKDKDKWHDEADQKAAKERETLLSYGRRGHLRSPQTKDFFKGYEFREESCVPPADWTLPDQDWNDEDLEAYLKAS